MCWNWGRNFLLFCYFGGFFGGFKKYLLVFWWFFGCFGVIVWVCLFFECGWLIFSRYCFVDYGGCGIWFFLFGGFFVYWLVLVNDFDVFFI